MKSRVHFESIFLPKKVWDDLDRECEEEDMKKRESEEQKRKQELKWLTYGAL
jgi:predicted HTH transcriptional regulator